MFSLVGTVYVIDLNQEDLKVEEIGGKALNLAKMSQAGFNIPPAFVVSVYAYESFINKDLEDKISEILDSVDFNQEDSVSKGCAAIKELIKEMKLPSSLYSEVTAKINSLPQGYYAVRSSAVSEDLEDASFAGQLDSFLNTKKEDILDRIVDCWASYWNDRAVKYRHDSSIPHQDTGIAVLVQKMVDADISGVTFTANPMDGTSNLVIESTWGLGEAIASGMVTPDTFVLDREGHLLEKEIKNKAQGYFLKDGENTLLSIEENYQEKSSLNEKILQELLQLGIRLEEFFGTPQDVEWALECDKDIYILQSRPVTTLTESSILMSVPRPAMLVAIVTAPGWPASAMISASDWCCLAFRTLCGMPLAVRSLWSVSETSTETVPTRTGCLDECRAATSSITAAYFSRLVL